MRRSPQRCDPWTVAGLIIYLAGMFAALAWGSSLERPYPCGGRRNCSAEVLRCR